MRTYREERVQVEDQGFQNWVDSHRKRRRLKKASRRMKESKPLELIFTCDDVVACKYGEESALALWSAGFQNFSCNFYDELGQYFTFPKEMDEVCSWLTASMGLDGYR